MPGEIVPVNNAITYSEYRAESQLLAPTLRANLIGTAIQQFCPLYSKFQPILDNVGKGALSPTAPERVLADTICGNNPTPPPEKQSQFQGGQCAGSAYEIRLAYTTIASSVNQGCSTRTPRALDLVARVFGEVSNIELKRPGTVPGDCDNKGYSNITCVCRGFAYPGTVGALQEVVLVGASQYNIVSLDEVTVTPISGQNDACGNIAPTYPPPNLTEPDFQRNHDVTIAPNTTISVPVSIKPTIFAGDFNLSPQFNVKVGDVNIKFDLGGITIEGDQPYSDGQTFPRFDDRTVKPDPVTVKQPTPSTGSGTCDLQPVLDAIDVVKKEVEECCDRYHPFSDLLTSDYDIRVLGSGNSGTYNLPSKTYRVVVELLDSPILHDEYAGFGGRNVAQVGWCWFVSGGGVMTRQPIDSAIKAFEVPPRTDDSFAFTMKRNYNAKVTAYFSKK